MNTITKDTPMTIRKRPNSVTSRSTQDLGLRPVEPTRSPGGPVPETSRTTPPRDTDELLRPAAASGPIRPRSEEVENMNENIPIYLRALTPERREVYGRISQLSEAAGLSFRIYVKEVERLIAEDAVDDAVCNLVLEGVEEFVADVEDYHQWFHTERLSE
jgi:hypothetical protein